MDYIDTGRKFYDPIEVKETEMSIEECTYRLLAVESPDENLCDSKSDGTCEGTTYYTDDFHAITKHCDKHFNQYVSEGIFVEIKQPKESQK